MASGVPREVSRQREETAWRLRQQCRSEDDIARQLGVSQPAVSKMLRRVEARALRSLSADVGRTKARQTAQLEWAASEAARAWERSLEDAESEKTIEAADVEDGDPTARREKTVKGQSGNPQHLAQLRGALTDIRAIWGLDAPQKIAPTDPAGNSLVPGFLEALAKAYGDRNGVKPEP